MDRRVKISPGTGLVLTVLYFEEQLFRCLDIYIYNIYIIEQLTERHPKHWIFDGTQNIDFACSCQYIAHAAA